MNNPLHHPNDDKDELAFLEQSIRFDDGLLGPDETAALAAELRQNPERLEEFIALQLHSASLHEALQNEEHQRTASVSTRRGTFMSGRIWMTVTAGLAMLLFIGVWLSSSLQDAQLAQTSGSPAAVESAESSRVILTEGSHARFFGKESLIAGNSLKLLQDYMLLGGLIKLSFPSGATAIIEAPAMFRVLDEECLTIVTGACSVHAPSGAEGFRVMTPLTQVVDRGTRFSIKVKNNSETEVQVIEGAADLYPVSDAKQLILPPASVPTSSAVASGVRLLDQQAVRLSGFETPFTEPASFNPNAYRRQLPDRIVSYEATKNSDNAAEELLSVSVQRGGVLQKYLADELIPIEVVWFRSDEAVAPYGHLAGGMTLPARPQEWLEDRKLNTGLINFGGQPEALQNDPVTTPVSNAESSGTPGLGIRFRSPVVNRPGPDVILFELQDFTNSLEGDRFHVTPVTFRAGLKSMTVTSFDLTMNSSEALELAPFWLHRFTQPVFSLAELGSLESHTNIRFAQWHFRAIAVGIDLSMMGYADGEQVSELFFQNAASGGESQVDPVFIGGFPAGSE